jgi:hypothetical protein
LGDLVREFIKRKLPTPPDFLYIVAVSFLVVLPTALVFDLELPQQLSMLKSYVLLGGLGIGLVFAVLGALISRQFRNVRKGKDIPEEITFIENYRCHVLHRIGVAEYSKIAEYILKSLMRQPAESFQTLVVFAMCAFEPCEIWRIVEQEWRMRGNLNSPTVDNLYRIAQDLFPHFKLFNDFSERYPAAIGRLLLLPADWRSRNEGKHFDLFCKLNGNVECYVALTTNFPHIQFKTDHTIIQDQVLDYYTDSQTLIISHLDRWQNPQVIDYLLGLANCYKNRNNDHRLEKLENWRKRNNV